MAVYLLGDLHLSVYPKWRGDQCEIFLNFLESLETNPEKDYLIQLGDIADSITFFGKTVNYLYKFFKICEDKFKHSYILMGNHDLGYHKGVLYSSNSLAKEFRKITILDKPAEILDVDDFKVLSLPFYFENKNTPKLDEFYSNLPDPIKNQSYDLIIGHFTDKSLGLMGGNVDISYLNSKFICLGHYHLNDFPNYIGSCFPCRFGEEERDFKPRSIWKLSSVDNVMVKEEIIIPKTCEFREITYPEEAINNHPVTIWTIKDLPSESALEKYKDLYIRNYTLIKPKYNVDDEDAKNAKLFKNKTFLEYFLEWSKSLNIAEDVLEYIADLFKHRKVSVWEGSFNTTPFTD